MRSSGCIDDDAGQLSKSVMERKKHDYAAVKIADEEYYRLEAKFESIRNEVTNNNFLRVNLKSRKQIIVTL